MRELPFLCRRKLRITGEYAHSQSREQVTSCCCCLVYQRPTCSFSGKKLIELAGFRDPTVLQDKHAVKALHEFGVDVVRDNDTRCSFHLLDGVDDLISGSGIQCGSGLIEQQYLVFL